MKKFTIPVGVYKAEVFIWISTPEEAEKEYQKTQFYKYEHITRFQKNGAKTLCMDGFDPIVWVDSNLKGIYRTSSIAHEFFHVIIYLMDSRNCRIDPNNDEPYAYLMEYLMKSYLNNGKFK